MAAFDLRPLDLVKSINIPVLYSSVLKDGRISLEIPSFNLNFFFSKLQNEVILVISLSISST
jgi:hypothetical protein